MVKRNYHTQHTADACRVSLLDQLSRPLPRLARYTLREFMEGLRTTHAIFFFVDTKASLSSTTVTMNSLTNYVSFVSTYVAVTNNATRAH